MELAEPLEERVETAKINGCMVVCEFTDARDDRSDDIQACVRALRVEEQFARARRPLDTASIKPRTPTLSPFGPSTPATRVVHGPDKLRLPGTRARNGLRCVYFGAERMALVDESWALL